MKLTTFLFFLAITQIVASEAYSQTTKMTLQLSNATVKEVLTQIEEKSEFFFLYNSKLVDVSRKVSVNAKDERIDVILNNLFQETGIVYTVVDRQIVLTNKADQAGFIQQNGQQQGKKVTGKVTDSSGGSLPGVSVVVKGTTTGIVTDNNGSFSLTNIPENATLIFSFVGMKRQEIAVGNKTTIKLVMEEETIGIDEVVAIGYGTMKKSDLTGSVARANLEIFQEQPSISIIKSLQGVIPGVNVGITTLAGQDPSILIRGVKTISGTSSPLIVLDGIIYRGSLVDLNKDDVEAIDVLKDASSAAIYGSQAANGVILITTKKGASNVKPMINYSSYYSVGTGV